MMPACDAKLIAKFCKVGWTMSDDQPLFPARIHKNYLQAKATKDFTYPLSPPNTYKASFHATRVCLLRLEMKKKMELKGQVCK